MLTENAWGKQNFSHVGRVEPVRCWIVNFPITSLRNKGVWGDMYAYVFECVITSTAWRVYMASVAKPQGPTNGTKQVLKRQTLPLAYQFMNWYHLLTTSCYCVYPLNKREYRGWSYWNYYELKQIFFNKMMCCRGYRCILYCD